MAIELTNNLNFPEVFVKACLVDRHFTQGDISTTRLVDAPQIRMLRANNDIQEDVSDRLWMLFGTAMHNILERAEISHFGARAIMQAAEVFHDMEAEKDRAIGDRLVELCKEKFPAEFESKDLIEHTLSVVIDGMEISGTMDKFVFETGTLQDYKVTGSYAYVYEESKKKWYAQQNIYAYMLREHGYTVNNAEIIALFKDWNKFKTFKQKDYPKSPVMQIPVKLIEHERVHNYLKSRVELHRRAQAGEQIDCTGKERWATAASFAVKRPGGKRAVKIFDQREFAEKYVEDKRLEKPDLFIEDRPGENRRCNEYCPVKDVCPQKLRMDEEAKMQNID